MRICCIAAVTGILGTISLKKAYRKLSWATIAAAGVATCCIAAACIDRALTAVAAAATTTVVAAASSTICCGTSIMTDAGLYLQGKPSRCGQPMIKAFVSHTTTVCS